MALDLTGITNEREFYTDHYIDSVLEDDLRPVFAKWTAAEDSPADSLIAAVRRCGAAWPAMRAELDGLTDLAARLDCQRAWLRTLLDALGYPQQIIWNKGCTVLTRTHYWYQHEPCWYVRKKNAAWFGKAGENSTIWDSPSPKFIMGGSDEEKYDHPTQKPVDLMRRPILNHIKRGELVYDPFLGSATTLAAAELTERVCYGIELDPKYVDVGVQRWQALSGEQATLDGDGRTFEAIAEERQREPT